MAPKKKGSTAVGPSTSSLPVPTQTGDGVDAGVGGSIDPELPRPHGDQSQVGDDARGAAKSKDGVVLPTDGVANSKNGAVPSKTPTPAHTPRPSQVTRDEQRRGVQDARRSIEKAPVHRSRDAQGHHARQHGGGSEARSRGRDVAPSKAVRSQSTSRSLHRSPPTTPAEA